MAGVLEGKVAIVTGAGRGLGIAEASELAREGAVVAVLARTLADVEATAESIRSAGGRVLPLRCDVRDRTMVREAIEATVQTFGSVDILVNNAQMAYNAHPLEEWTDGEMRDVWESGPVGSWHFMQECFPHMRRQGAGRIINFVSPAGHGRVLGFSCYSMAKEATRTLTRCGAREWGKYNINVNAISPIAMSPTVIEFGFDDAGKADALLDELGTALRRYGDPTADVARCVVFLAGPDSSFVTGCTLGVDGGSAIL